MADDNLNGNVNNVANNSSFLCGVVEGFYGRPWTPEQRKDLFCKQEKWGMNCYLYAPKDDYKHRAFWRELYTVEEAEHLQALITEARKHNVTFYYAISPGLDIAYSSQKELAALKRKLEQVQQLGCSAFAILFDDIYPEMSGADKEVYQSFAHAQVSVANEMFTHLNQPKFMLCPTQYCSTRAVPSVLTSEYLNTLGAKLAPEIDIMWTGPKVISKTLTVEHIREVSSVLRRPPVIWDNLHANDYDHARLFLGPYCGRSPSLIPLLRGVVTNPNCEYGPNFIAIHTLSQWARSNTEETCGDTSELKDDAVSADIRLETEGDDSNHCPTGLPPSTYHPRRALKLALQEWLAEFDISVLSTGPIQQPQIPTPIPIVPSVNTCMSLTSTTTQVPCTLPTIISNVNQVAEVIQDPSLMPTNNLVMNSLVSETKIDTLLAAQVPEAESSIISLDGGSTTSSAEPMECNHSPVPSTDPAEDQMVVDQTKPITSDTETASQQQQSPDPIYIDTAISPDNTSIGDHASDNKDLQLTLDDLFLLSDLFYLPFEHGKKGITIMTEFNWLKSNSHLVIEHNRNNPDGTRKPEVQEWFDKASKFSTMNDSVTKLSERVFNTRNRSLLYELCPYLWDMRGVVSLLNSYVQWLALGQVSTLVSNYVHGNYTWFSKGWREAFMSGEQEPWIFRGGLTAELQRLIPVDASNDLFMYKPPEEKINKCYVIRPYLDTDRAALYRLVMLTADDGKDATPLYGAHPSLCGDVGVGSFLRAEVSDRIVMVVEDEGGEMVGYCCAATNARAHAALHNQHITIVREQYPKVVQEEGTMLTACEQLLASLWADPPPFPLTTAQSGGVTATPPIVMSRGTTPPSSTTVSITPSHPTIAIITSSTVLASHPTVAIVTPSTVLASQPITSPPLQQASPATVDISVTTSSSISSSTTNTTTSSVPLVAGAVTATPLTPSPTPSPEITLNGVLGVTARLATTPAPVPTPVGDMLPYYPALIRIAMLSTLADESILKRLVTCIFASLRAKGGFGGHINISTMDKGRLELYSKVGFSEIGSIGDTVYLARSF